MRIEEGEAFGFLGPNGAGKSTTIKLLMGIIFPTSGSARILGRPITEVEMHKDIGYLPEQPYFYDYLTAAELLDYFARFYGMKAAERKGRVAKMLKKVGLETAGKIQLRKYSKGMLQRVGLAQAILHDPKVVILDEPMSVLFSTHILTDAETLCDRVGVIVGGKLQGVGRPDEIVGIKAHEMEIVFDADANDPRSAGMRAKANKSGSRFTLRVAEENVFPALEELRAAGAKLGAVTPIKPTLEEYFLHLVEKDRAQAAAIEVSGK